QRKLRVNFRKIKGSCEMIRVGVRIMPREVILDTQGRAVENTLKLSGVKIDSVRVGKFIELKIDETNEAKAMERAEQIAKTVLHNPLIENYELSVMK
ncbi:MAG: phosphoribosylformylglycinamidine synthase subunit PurS, partial [Pseudobdellovibrionaceae bacterium]